MELSSIKFGLACAITSAILWVICSLLVILLPDFMNYMTAGMMHGDTLSIDFIVTWPGFLWGLFGWVVWAAAAGWILAVIYNQLLLSKK